MTTFLELLSAESEILSAEDSLKPLFEADFVLFSGVEVFLLSSIGVVELASLGSSTPVAPPSAVLFSDFSELFGVSSATASFFLVCSSSFSSSYLAEMCDWANL